MDKATIHSVVEERGNAVDSNGRCEVKIRVGNLRGIKSEVEEGSVGYEDGFGRKQSW